MSEQDVGRLIYLGLLGVVLLSYLVVSHRARLGALLRGAILWGLLFLGVAVGAMLWQDLRGDHGATRAVSFGDGRVEVPRDRSGHFLATLQVQGVPVRFIVDTGATDLVLTRADARRLGLDPDHLVYSGRAQTANGTVGTARIMLGEVTFGDFTDRNLRAWVNEGDLEYSLLGMGYLERFDRVEISRDRLVLFR